MSQKPRTAEYMAHQESDEHQSQPGVFRYRRHGALIARRGGVKYLACLLPLFACGADPSPGSPDAGQPDAQPPELRFFQHSLFTEPGDCPDDPEFNCYPSVELCSDGRAVMMVTDIVNGGTYTKNDGTVTTSWPSADVPSQIVFQTTADGRGLTDDWQGWLWEGSEPEFPSCE